MMFGWILSHWPDLAAGAVVIAIVAVCLRNILPRKGKRTCGSCSACAGCSGSCGGCRGQDSCPSCHR